MSSLSSTADLPDGRAGPETARTAGIRLKLFVGNSAIGVGQIDLLQQIGTTGSIRHAAAAMTMDVFNMVCLILNCASSQWRKMKWMILVSPCLSMKVMMTRH